MSADLAASTLYRPHQSYARLDSWLVVRLRDFPKDIADNGALLLGCLTRDDERAVRMVVDQVHQRRFRGVSVWVREHAFGILDKAHLTVQLVYQRLSLRRQGDPALSVFSDDVSHDGTGLRECEVAVGDDGGAPKGVDVLEGLRCAKAIALVSLNVVGHFELFLCVDEAYEKVSESTRLYTSRALTRSQRMRWERELAK